MLKRLAILIFVVALALPLLPTAAQGDITLRWRTRPDNQDEINVYQAANDAIDAAWDGVNLVYEPGGSETASYQDVLITEIESDTAPDVFWIPGTDVARFAKAGLILNLAEYDAADDEFTVDDFYPQIMDLLQVSLDGEPSLWGIPRDVSAFAIYYNADLFDAAGIDYPDADWDWDDLYEAAAEISALGDDIKGFGVNNWWANYGYFLNAAGARFFTDDLHGCGLGVDGTVEALEFMASLYNGGVATPWGEDAEPVFRAGKLGMFINGRWATPGMVAGNDFNWNVAELPIGPAEQSNWLFWGAYVVNANTDYPDAAWELATRLTAGEIQGQVAALGANIPSRVGGSAIDDFLATFPDLGLNNQAFLNGLSYGVAETPVWFGSWSDIDATYYDNVTAVLNGQQSAQEFADTICDKVDQYFEPMN